jgi:hypothetical protein
MKLRELTFAFIGSLNLTSLINPRSRLLHGRGPHATIVAWDLKRLTVAGETR